MSTSKKHKFKIGDRVIMLISLTGYYKVGDPRIISGVVFDEIYFLGDSYCGEGDIKLDVEYYRNEKINLIL